MTESRSDHRDLGFTMIELSVVMLIMAIVLAIAATSLLSLQRAASRNDAMIRVEQDAGGTLALMARDVRSAHAITFPCIPGSSGCSPTTNAAQTVILYLNQPTGATYSAIEWSYSPPSGGKSVGKLLRQVLDSNLAVQTTSVLLGDVANDANSPVFRYFDVKGQPITVTGSTANQTLINCTSAITVTLVVNPSPVPNVNSFKESTQVAITDQQQALSAPGNQQCGL